MCDPARLTALYKAVIEHAIGVTANTSDNDRALVFAHDDITYVLRNTAPHNPGLLDLAVYIPHDAHEDLKHRVCRHAALTVPCMKAWVDTDGDIVLNIQSLTGPIGLMPTFATIREILPQALQMMNYATTQVCQNLTIADIMRATEESADAMNHHVGLPDNTS